jgi:hypothetical protein
VYLTNNARHKATAGDNEEELEGYAKRIDEAATDEEKNALRVELIQRLGIDGSTQELLEMLKETQDQVCRSFR